MPKLGKPLNLTNKQLEKLAEVTTEDVERVNKKWVFLSVSVLKNLLIAEKE